MMCKLLILILIVFVGFSHEAKILGIFDFPSKSHHILGSALLKALAKKGHEVTMLSPFPLKTPVKNYEDIELKHVLKYKEEQFMDKMIQTLDEDSSPFQKIAQMSQHTASMTIMNEMVLNQTVDAILKTNKNFDLVIQNWFFNPAYLGLAHRLNAPVIAFSGGGSSMLTNRITANPEPYSYVPNVLLGFPSEMNFYQRFINTLTNIFFNIFFNVFGEAHQVSLYQKYFPNGPPLGELEKNISLVFLNSHFAIESPRPYVPSLIHIGGFHVEEPRELTGDLKTFMDSAQKGVVYFSLGSNVRSADLPKAKRDSIVKALGRLPVKVLWKFETDDIPNLPSNIKIGKWLPQRDILAHPNLKVFVTHGGLLSTTEAVYHGVPVVGIPLFADQSKNIATCIHKGFAVEVSYPNLNENVLYQAIMKVLSNQSYKENATQLSSILKDRPVKPIDNAIFWVEYVLRHKGAHHLKTSALKLAWYQYLLLDVFLLISVILFVLLFVVHLIVSRILRFIKKLIFGKGSKKKQH